MRQLTPLELERIEALTKCSIESALLEPTDNGLRKSIMDATISVRSFLKEKGIHDYIYQHQGPESKLKIAAGLVDSSKIYSSMASLYRPNTKAGDPRIWFTNLTSYAQASDILALFTGDDKLYVINITRLDVIGLLQSTTGNPLKELAGEIQKNSLEIANELLFLLRALTRRGPVPALLTADTAIGRTLEHALGITINSSQQPDFKGIELKSFRESKKNRKTLFAQVPNWQLSRLKSSHEILNKFGYDKGSDKRLYCTVSTLKQNSQGLRLRLDAHRGLLVEDFCSRGGEEFVTWTLEALHAKLKIKHNETFWISGQSIMIDGQEHFLYKSVEHTKKPIVSQFDFLLDQGKITMDHLIKKDSSGKVVEKGPLFKIKPDSINLLFPPSTRYDLRS